MEGRKAGLSWNCTGAFMSSYRAPSETLVLRQFPAASVYHLWLMRHQADGKWWFSSLPTFAEVSCAPRCLGEHRPPKRHPAHPPVLASSEHRSSLPTAWSFSAFSLGRERMKGQEEGGLRPRKKACCPLPSSLPGGHILSPVSRRGVAQP